MEKLKLKREQPFLALERLNEAVVDLKQINDLTEEQAKTLEQQFGFLEKERMYRARRDSLIQRFEICIDMFLKYLKLYMTDYLKRNIEVSSPKTIIRDAHNAKLLTEEDTRILLDLINYRNMSSHIYKEEMADQISTNVSRYYDVLKRSIELLKKNDF